MYPKGTSTQRLFTTSLNATSYVIVRFVLAVGVEEEVVCVRGMLEGIAVEAVEEEAMEGGTVGDREEEEVRSVLLVLLLVVVARVRMVDDGDIEGDSEIAFLLAGSLAFPSVTVRSVFSLVVTVSSISSSCSIPFSSLLLSPPSAPFSFSCCEAVRGVGVGDAFPYSTGNASSIVGTFASSSVAARA